MNNEVKIYDCGQSAGKTVVTENEKWFLAGLIEGESSFTASVKNFSSLDRKLVIDPEFFIYQHKIRRGLLELALKVFNVGRIKPKPGNEDVLEYQVTSTKEIYEVIIPFLNQYMIYSHRKSDIEKFKQIVNIVYNKQHFIKENKLKLVDLAFSMNMNGKNRRVKKQDVINRILRDYTLGTDTNSVKI